MKKLIIHIGYPKTATTSLQFNLFTRLMKEGKIEYLNHLRAGNKDQGDISVEKILSSIMGIKSNIDYSDEVEIISKIDSPLSIISNESISHVSGKSLKASYRTGAFWNAKKIKKIFSPYFDSIEIIMTIRAQITIIPSYYTQEYFNIINDKPNFKDIGEWTQNNFGENIQDDNLMFNYKKMYSTYAKYFGEKNVHVLVYEDLLHDKIRYYKQIATILELKPKIIQKYFETTVRNKTVISEQGKVETDKGTLKSLLVLLTYRTFKFNDDSRLFNVGKKILKIIVPASILNFKTGHSESIRGLSDDELELITTRFSLNNRQLFDLIGLDIDRMTSYKYL